MNSVEQREIWVDCLIIALIISLTFLILCCKNVIIWFEEEIPNSNYRVLSISGVIFIVAFVTAGLILTRREEQHRDYHHFKDFPPDLDEELSEFCDYIMIGEELGKRDWIDRSTLRTLS